MKREEAKKRIEALTKEVNYHRYLYHVLDKQEISDAALDSLKNELARLEEQFPEFLKPDSPTQRVGGAVLPEFKKVSHHVRMTSLNDAFSEEEMKDWEERILRFLGGVTSLRMLHPTSRGRSDLQYFAEAKGDGFAVSLIYEKGVFKIGSTRGDGLVGEDVTENLKTVEAIPLKINVPWEEWLSRRAESREILDKFPRVKQSLRHLPAAIEARGEVYMGKKEFEAMNKEQKKRGLPLFANPRNIAAGSVRQLDPKITASRRLNFFAWDLVTDLGQETHEEEHMIMKILGFPVVPLTKKCRNLEEVFAFQKEVSQKREGLPYLIDGIVVQVNSGKIFDALGIVGKSPRAAIAFKFPAASAVSVVEKINVQVGRTGVLTPVALLKPVNIGGVTVRHATLHNLDEIRRLDVREGDTVIVERAGDVIPAVTGVLKRLRPKNSREFRMPRKCPVCGSLASHKKGEVPYYCSNKNCSALQREKLYHFVSKHALDIRGLGPKIIDALAENGLIRDAADIFTLKKEDLEELERFAEKSASNLVGAIAAKKNVDFSRFLFALGIHHVGEETALDLAKNFGSPEKLKNASLDTLQKVRDIGGIVAQSIYDWFRDKKNLELLAKFQKNGLKIRPYRKAGNAGKLEGKVFVLTGELEGMSREEVKEKIRESGGSVSESVSKKTDFVVAGRNPGSKLEKAGKLGVKIINKEGLLKLIR